MPTIPRAVCLNCARRMKPKENGATIEFQRGTEAEPFPYFKIQGDIWECPECDAAIVVGFGGNPLAEHYDKEKYDSIKADYVILP